MKSKWFLSGLMLGVIAFSVVTVHAMKLSDGIAIDWGRNAYFELLDSMHYELQFLIKEGSLAGVQAVLASAGVHVMNILKRVNKNEDSLFHFAALYQKNDILRLLVSAAKKQTAIAIVDIEKKTGKVITDAEKQIAKVIANIMTWQNNDGNTPLHFAARFNNPCMVVDILDAVGDKAEELLFIKNIDGQTALFKAVMFNAQEAVEEILRSADMMDSRKKLVSFVYDRFQMSAIDLAKHHGLSRLCDILAGNILGYENLEKSL